MMTTGLTTSNPTNFNDFYITLCNIKAQSWSANAFKSNFSHEQIQHALTILTGISFQSALDSSQDVVQSFIPDDDTWLELMDWVANYGVEESARIIRKSNIFPSSVCTSLTARLQQWERASFREA